MSTSMKTSRKNLKEKRQAERQRKQLFRRIAWGVVSVAALALVGYFVWKVASTPAAPAVGEAVPVDPQGRTHIPEDSDPGPYSTNPPTSGHHYPTPLSAGFYDTNIYPQYPQGHLVHSLEHGYVIFWYNCKKLSDSQCSEMKTQIKAVMDAAGGFKVIAYPWDSIDVPLVMTSWGYMLRFETFDPQLAQAFILQHRNRSPEPEAP